LEQPNPIVVNKKHDTIRIICKSDLYLIYFPSAGITQIRSRVSGK